MTALLTAHAMAKARARCSGIGSHAFGMILTLSSCKQGSHQTFHVISSSSIQVGEAVRWLFFGASPATMNEASVSRWDGCRLT